LFSNASHEYFQFFTSFYSQQQASQVQQSFAPSQVQQNVSNGTIRPVANGGLPNGLSGDCLDFQIFI
jgi:hypothetical protein